MALYEAGVGDVLSGGVAAVDGDGSIEVLGLGEEGVVLFLTDEAVADRRCEGTSEPEFRHGPAKAPWRTPQRRGGA